MKSANQSKSYYQIIHSSLIGRDNYIGYIIDWLILFCGAGADVAITVLSASIFVGTFLYINGMATDMKMRLASIDDDSPIEPRHSIASMAKWTIYVEEIQFHIAIIE